MPVVTVLDGVRVTARSRLVELSSPPRHGRRKNLD